MKTYFEELESSCQTANHLLAVLGRDEVECEIHDKLKDLIVNRLGFRLIERHGSLIVEPSELTHFNDIVRFTQIFR